MVKYTQTIRQLLSTYWLSVCLNILWAWRLNGQEHDCVCIQNQQIQYTGLVIFLSSVLDDKNRSK